MASYDNPFDLRRFASLASPQEQSPLPKAYRNVSFGSPEVGPIPRAQPAAPQQTPLQAALSRFTGTTAATDAYRQHLTELPQGGDYAPSKWRRLGAALTAGAGTMARNPKALEVAEGMRDAPFKNALTNWQLKGAGLKEQADMEATNTKGQLAYIESLRKQANEDEDNRRQNALAESTITANAAKIANYENQGWTKDYGPDGTILMIKGNKIIDTGIKSAKSTDITNDATRLRYEGTRVGNDTERTRQGGERVKQGWQNVAQGWAGVGQRQEGLGIEHERVGLAREGLTDTQKRTGIMQKDSDVRTANAGTSYSAPGSNDEAEAVAARRIARTNPAYAKYLDDKGFIKVPADYPESNWYNPGSWMNEAAPTTATDPTFKAFTDAVEAEKQKIIGTRRPGAYQRPGDGYQLDQRGNAPLDFNLLAPK